MAVSSPWARCFFVGYYVARVLIVLNIAVAFAIYLVMAAYDEASAPTDGEKGRG